MSTKAPEVALGIDTAGVVPPRVAVLPRVSATEISEILELAATPFHLPLDPELLRFTASRPVDEATEGSLFELLGQRARPLGLSAARLTLCTLDLVKARDHQLPLVLERGGRAVVVLETRNFQAKVQYNRETTWLSPRELARLVGAEDEYEQLRVLGWEQAMPLTSGAGEAADAKHDDHGGPVGLGRLVKLMKLERDDLFSVLIHAIFIGMTTLAVPIAVQAVVNTVAFGVLIQPLVVLTLLVLACLAFNGLLRAWQAKVVERMQERLFVRAAVEFAHRLPRIRVNAFDRVYAPEKVNRFFDVMTAQKAGAALLVDGSLLALQAIVGLVLLGFYHPLLLSFDFVLIVAVGAIIFGLGRRAVPTSLDESAAKYELVAWLQDVARSPIAFRMNQDAALENADDLARKYITSRRRHFAIVFKQIVASVTLQALASASLLAIGGYLVMEGQLSIGQLVAAELVVTSIVAGVSKLGKHLESYYDLRTALEKIGSVTDLELEISSATRVLVNPGPASLSFATVRFAHPNRPPLYDSLSFSVEAGETVAMVGAHGAGKSTVADLIYSLRAPSRGSILLDGVDVRELGVTEVRRHIALVRDVEIFDGTLYDNVALWRKDVTPSDVHDALGAVGLSETVARLGDGVRTRLLTGGNPLSLGQAQRLMLARALAGKPRLLVVDGLLDGLEGDLLEDIERCLVRVCQNRTTVLVLTSLETVASWCQRRIVLSRASGATELAKQREQSS